MDCLTENDWVSIGKQWADVPPRVKHTMAVILTIHDSIHQQLLPSKNLSIHQLVDDFTIPKGLLFYPRPAHWIISAAIRLTCSLSKMKRLPMPLASVTKKLVIDVKQPRLKDSRVTKMAGSYGLGLPKRLIFWMLRLKGCRRRP